MGGSPDSAIGLLTSNSSELVVIHSPNQRASSSSAGSPYLFSFSDMSRQRAVHVSSVQSAES